MATYVENRPDMGSTTPHGNETNSIIGIILLLVALFLLIFYGIPALQGAANPGSPQINVPGQIDVNVNPGQGGGPGNIDQQ